MNQEYYKRKITFSIDDSEYNTGDGDLRVGFNISKNLFSESNVAYVSIYNLSQTTRGEIKKASFTDTREVGSLLNLKVGYEKTLQQLFEGEIIGIEHKKYDVDWISRLTVKNAFTELITKTVNHSFTKGKNLKDIVDFLQEQLGVDEVNYSSVESLLSAKNFDRGYVLNGSIKANLDVFAKLIDATWSIQDKKLVLLAKGQSLTTDEIIISGETGLIGNPTKKQTGWELRTILDPNIKVGSLLKVVSQNFDPFLMVPSQIDYIGDNYADDFYCNIKGLEYDG